MTPVTPVTAIAQELDRLPDGPGVHRASAICAVPALQAFAFLADGLQLGRWALGAWDTQPVGDGVVRGHSLFDDQPSWVKPVGDAARLRIDYHVGGAADRLTPRILATVEAMRSDAADLSAADAHADAKAEVKAGAGSASGGTVAACCRITLHAARDPSMDDARWLRLVRCHELEVLLIQSRVALAMKPELPPAPTTPESDSPRSSRP